MDRTAYVAWCRSQGHAAKTIETRLAGISSYEHDEGPLERATDATVVRFLDNYAGWTRAGYARTLKSGFTYLSESGFRPPRIPKVKNPDPRPKPITDRELRALIEPPPDPPMLAWLNLAAYAGLRSMEIAATGPQYLDGSRLTLPQTKGGQVAVVTIPSWLAESLAQTDPWTITASDLSQQTSRYMRSRGVSAGIHRLRHWHATTLLRQTDNIRLVQRALRHKSIQTTVAYTLIDDDELAAAVNNINRVA
jgi:integrase/recombinase XerD